MVSVANGDQSRQVKGMMMMSKQIKVSLVVIMLTLFACSATHTREKALNTSLLAVNSARDGFMVYDLKEQEAIVERATSLESGKAELVAYRERRAKVIRAFVVAYLAIGVAASKTDDLSLKSAMLALADLTRAVDEVMNLKLAKAVP